jgi:hypothetical protein
MTVTYPTFLLAFNEFQNQSKYPPATVTFWIGQAYLEIDPCRFGTSEDLAVMLFVAHNITLSARNAASANAGGVVGEANGPVSSKSVGPVSVGYDTAAAALAGAGPWNLTSYGQRFYEMLKQFYRGPAYVPGPSSNVGAILPYGRGYGFGRFRGGWGGW